MTYPLARPATPPLDAASCPADPRRLPDSALARLAHEVRAETISAVSGAGRHSGAGLGVAELTVAIHAVFDTPRDKLIFDVGHQCHPHKILTGRRDRIRTLRQGGGLSGFTKRSESEHDPFGAAHGSTSISAGLGFAAARDLGARDVGDAVRVIGDGAMTAGLAREAMNDAGDMDSRLLVILNDNDMSIAPPVGALSTCLAGLRTERPALEMRKAAEAATDLPPEPFRTGARRARELVRGMARRGTPFEELGFTYLGPVDGQHAVTFCAGMAAAGMKPVAAICSTFLQRGHARSCMTWRCKACRCASRSIARGWRAPTGRPMRAASMARICRACRTWWRWPRPMRRSWRACSPPRSPMTRGPRRRAIRAAREPGSRSRCAPPRLKSAAW